MKTPHNPYDEHDPSLAVGDLLEEQAVVWFVRLRAEQVTCEEKAAFADWLKQTPAHQQAFDEICLLWGDTGLRQALNDAEKKLPNYNDKSVSQRRFYLPLLITACLALFLVFHNDVRIFFRADYATAIGEQKTVRLDDGSSVILNTNSAFAVTMMGGQRTVELLQGEAFFDVKSDASRPFIVYGEHSTTRVLGTRFFVHEKNDSAEVKVLSGRVEVTDNRHWREPVILHAHDAVSINREGLSKTGKLDAKLTTSWVGGYLIFQDAALSDVIEQVERYRNGIVIFKDDSLRQFKINGRVNLRDPRHILETLEKTLSVKITHLTDWLVIIG